MASEIRTVQLDETTIAKQRLNNGYAHEIIVGSALSYACVPRLYIVFKKKALQKYSKYYCVTSVAKGVYT
jgi:hypothetical protein